MRLFYLVAEALLSLVFLVGVRARHAACTSSSAVRSTTRALGVMMSGLFVSDIIYNAGFGGVDCSLGHFIGDLGYTTFAVLSLWVLGRRIAWRRHPVLIASVIGLGMVFLWVHSISIWPQRDRLPSPLPWWALLNSNFYSLVTALLASVSVAVSWRATRTGEYLFAQGLLLMMISDISIRCETMASNFVSSRWAEMGWLLGIFGLGVSVWAANLTRSTLFRGAAFLGPHQKCQVSAWGRCFLCAGCDLRRRYGPWAH